MLGGGKSSGSTSSTPSTSSWRTTPAPEIKSSKATAPFSRYKYDCRCFLSDKESKSSSSSSGVFRCSTSCLFMGGLRGAFSRVSLTKGELLRPSSFSRLAMRASSDIVGTGYAAGGQNLKCPRPTASLQKLRTTQSTVDSRILTGAVAGTSNARGDRAILLRAIASPCDRCQFIQHVPNDGPIRHPLRRSTTVLHAQ